jgi:hypothetical protein
MVNWDDRRILVEQTLTGIEKYTKVWFWPILTILGVIGKLWLDLDISWLLVFVPLMAWAGALLLVISIVLAIAELRARWR